MLRARRRHEVVIAQFVSLKKWMIVEAGDDQQFLLFTPAPEGDHAIRIMHVDHLDLPRAKARVGSLQGDGVAVERE